MSNPLAPKQPPLPASLVRKGAIPAALLAALSSPLALVTLERVEGNILQVYEDRLAEKVPTFCAGRTDWTAKLGTKLTSDDCREVNKITLLEYGYAILGCVNWDYLDANRLIGLTLFAINVGKSAACNSQSVQKINQGNIKQGCTLLSTRPDGSPNWSYASGVYVQGLQNRRKVEVQFCLGDVA